MLFLHTKKNGTSIYSGVDALRLDLTIVERITSGNTWTSEYQFVVKFKRTRPRKTAPRKPQEWAKLVRQRGAARDGTDLSDKCTTSAPGYTHILVPLKGRNCAQAGAS